MIHYEITRRDGPAVLGFTKRHQAPAARTALWGAVWDMLDANALRDRPVAYRLLAEVDAAEIAPPPRGHYRSQSFKLGGSYMDQVTLYVYRTRDGHHI